MPINFDNAFGIHEQAMTMRSYRGRILATNLANADTPNYKARDVDFKAVLGRVAEARNWKGLQTTHQKHFQEGDSGPSGTELQYRIPLQPSIDGNTVDPHMEQAAFMKNALAYQASLQFLNGRIKGLMTAIRGD